MVIRFTIPGEPKGKGRPRLGRSGHAYTPHDTAVYENLVKLCYRDENPDDCETACKDEPVSVLIWAYYQIPKSVSKKTRLAMQMDDIRPSKKPDCDNIAKIICDALNGLAYYDDSQICELTVFKHYSETPRVEVKIEYGK